ncbi:MAG: DUF721 domain-containing protein [Candidatus Hydrogenedentes bacterium]|nr:DUF721 domain-containing protein [Candidatus Hydrogenedentota bacterium]
MNDKKTRKNGYRAYPKRRRKVDPDAPPIKPLAVGDILKNLKASSDLGKRLQQAEIWARWPELAGPNLAAHGFPKTIRDNMLYIEADSPVWMNRFAYEKWGLLKRINKLAGREVVSDVFITLKNEDSDPSAQHGV